MIALNSMTFGYGNNILFDKMDLNLKPGSIYGLLGLNGAGKTSLLKLIAGALLPHKGELEVGGHNPIHREASFLASVAFVPEDPWVPALKPVTFLHRNTPFRPSFDQITFDRLFQEFDLDKAKALSKYSYGQRKKFCLAFALASGAKIILLDEPTNGLDIPSKVLFRKMLASASTEDRIILISTHQVRDLENLIDPVLIMDKGKIPFNLPMAELGEKFQGAGLNDLEVLFNTAITHPESLTQLLGGQ